MSTVLEGQRMRELKFAQVSLVIVVGKLIIKEYKGAELSQAQPVWLVDLERGRLGSSRPSY